MSRPRPICDTPGCGMKIPVGGEGHPEICPKCLKNEEMIRLRSEASDLNAKLHELSRRLVIARECSERTERFVYHLLHSKYGGFDFNEPRKGG